MASSHRVTDLEKNPVRITKDEAPTPLSVAGPLFISSLLFHLVDFALLLAHFKRYHDSEEVNVTHSDLYACIHMAGLSLRF